MLYQIVLDDAALDELRALPKDLRRRIGQRLEVLSDSLQGDVKKLAGEKRRYRLRVVPIGFCSCWMAQRSTFMLLDRGKKLMGSTLQRPKEPTLKALASEMSRLRERVDDLEDLRDLLTAERAAGDRPGIPWEQAKKLLDLDNAPSSARTGRTNKKKQ